MRKVDRKSRSHEQLKRSYSVKNHEELARLFDEWCDEYDQDVQVFAPMNYAIVAGMVERYVGTSAGEIFDAGCGTGIMGEILNKLGYHGLVGIDISKGMLGVADQKGAYDELKIMTLGESLFFDDDHFAATLAIGVLTFAHAPADSLDEIIRVTKRGGFVIFALTEPAYQQLGFKEKLADLEKKECWKLEESTPHYHGTVPSPSSKQPILNRVFVYRTL